MAIIAETPEQVRAWFDGHPEARELLESTEFQWRCWRPEFEHGDYYRLLTVDDVRRVTQGGWFDEPGTFAWYYPDGVPHYMCVEEPPAIEWPEDREFRSEETYAQMKARHADELCGVDGGTWYETCARHSREVLDAMWDDEFAIAAFADAMGNVEYSYTVYDEDVLGQFGHVSSCDYERGIAELGLPKRICAAYREAAREVMGHEE